MTKENKVNLRLRSLLPKCISAWNGLAQENAEANILDLFKSKLAHKTPSRSISNHICERILLITEPELTQILNFKV